MIFLTLASCVPNTVFWQKLQGNEDNSLRRITTFLLIPFSPSCKVIMATHYTDFPEFSLAEVALHHCSAPGSSSGFADPSPRVVRCGSKQDQSFVDNGSPEFEGKCAEV